MAQIELSKEEKGKLDVEKFLDRMERWRENEELRAMNGSRCGNRQAWSLNTYSRPQGKYNGYNR